MRIFPVTERSALPWYVWITYDGDARAFARVHANPEGLSAP